MDNIAEKARTVTWACRRIMRLRGDVENNRVVLEDIITIINSLTIPRGWVGLDADGKLHVTWYAKRKAGVGMQPGQLFYIDGNANSLSTPIPSGLLQSADYAWEYDQVTNAVKCIKSRCGRWFGQIVKCEPNVLPEVH